jgi:uncharacterized membrane protein YsdA (DUF1294 family)
MLKIVKLNKNKSEHKAENFKPIPKSRFAIASVVFGIIGTYMGYFVTMGGTGISPFNVIVIFLGVIAWNRRENRILTIAGLTLGIVPVLILAVTILLFLTGLIE